MIPIKTRIVGWWMRIIGIIFIIIGVVVFYEKMKKGEITNLVPVIWFSMSIPFFIFSTSLFKKKIWGWVGSLLLLSISSLISVIATFFLWMACEWARTGACPEVLLLFPLFFLPFFIPFALLVSDRKNYLEK